MNRSLRTTACILIAGLLAVPAMAQDEKAATFPTLRQQLQQDRVKTGSALENLILANQDFQLLNEREAKDNIRVPAWLRVLYKKNHPDHVYNFKDPSGGYPLVLKEIHEWMLTHQDLQVPLPEIGYTPEGDMDRASVSGEKRISGAATNSRSESDIRVSPFNSTRVISASNNIGGSGAQAQYYSTDGGLTWGVSFLPIQTGLSDSFHSDPTVDWTSDGTAWSTTMGINSAATVLKVRAYKSTDNGATWTYDNVVSGSQTNTDKQMMWVDHFAASPFKDRIYVCWHNGNPAYANYRSSTGWGATPVQISSTETTGTAIGCDVKSNGNGDAFVFWPDTGSRGIYMVKSTNGGVSWTAPKKIATSFDSYDIGVPSFNSRRILIYTYGAAYRTATKNLVYASWTDLTGATGCTSATNEPGSNAASTCKTRVWFARSTDGGTTWSAPYMVNNQASLNDQFNQAIAVDETTGNIAMIYYDTVSDSTRKKTDIWYQVSTNDGVSFGAAQKITTAQTDETIAGADSGNQYGDYNSLSGYASVFFPSWTDRRSGGKEEIWTAAISEAPCTAPAAPTGLSATAASYSQINLSWTAVSGATSYNVYRSTTSGGPYTSVGSSATTSFSNTGLTGNTTYYYVVRAVSGCESANSAQASATTPAPPSCTTTTLYSNNFDAATGMSDWTKGTFLSGGSTTDWRGVQTCTAASGTKIFRMGNTGCTTDYVNGDFNFAIPKGATGIAFGSIANTSRLTFKHRRAFESGYDGGTLYISLDGTNYTQVPTTAVLSGGSTTTTNTACPPTGGGGKWVWTGTSTTFTTTTVDLDAACNAAGSTTGCAGKTVRIAFTTITDCSTTGDGWFLDDVTVTACQ